MNAKTNEGLRHWLEQRTTRWRRLGELTQKLRRGRNHDPEDVATVVTGYRSLSRDISLAQRVLPNSRLSHLVESLYLDLHTLLHRPASRPLEELKNLLVVQVPQIFRDLRTPIIVVTCLFVFAALAGGWLVHSYPDLAGLFLSARTIEEVQQGKLWTDDMLNIMPSSVLALGIFTNNAMVSFVAFSLGVFYGLGTLYIIGLNGFMLGAIFAFTARHGLADELFTFVVAHGIVELSVICVAGATGVLLGEALARPGDRSRTRAFQEASQKGLRLMVMLVVLLFGCGVIEGYISPNPIYPLSMRVAVGVGWAIVAWLMITGQLWRLFGWRSDTVASP